MFRCIQVATLFTHVSIFSTYALKSSSEMPLGSGSSISGPSSMEVSQLNSVPLPGFPKSISLVLLVPRPIRRGDEGYADQHEKKP